MAERVRVRLRPDGTPAVVTREHGIYRVEILHAYMLPARTHGVWLDHPDMVMHHAWKRECWHVRLVSEGSEPDLEGTLVRETTGLGWTLTRVHEPWT